MANEKIEKATLLLLENAESYNRIVFEEVRPFLKGNIFEVGCGIGNLTQWLIKQNRVTVADMNEDYLKIFRKKFTDHPNLLNSLIWDIRKDFPYRLDHLFETIVCSNVLEHIEEDELVLRRFYNILPEGGRIILFVPALRKLYNRLDKELGHLRRYGKKDLLMKFKDSGFKIFHLKYFNLFGILGWFFNGNILKKRVLPKKQLYIFDRFLPFLIKIEKAIPNFLGQSLIAVGEK